MLKNLKKRLKDQRGLTLVELLAVIVILGIIAAIAVPSIGNIIENSKKEAIKADALQILGAAKIYNAEYGELPKDGAKLDDLKDYIDSLTTFKEFTVTKTESGLAISGEGSKDSVKIIFNNATAKDINDAKKEDTSIPR